MINRDHPILDAAEVAPRLWIGSHPPVDGHHCADHPIDYHADMRSCGFDVLVLCAEEYQPDASKFPGVRVFRAPFHDDHNGLDERQLKIAFEGARQTVVAHRQGGTCLVTCMAGRNRSGLVCALAIAALAPMDPAKAGQLVRDRRGLGALTNPTFRGILNRVRVGGVDQAETCELCEARPLTRRYHEDGLCWIADCKSCGVPMVVYREHGALPPPAHMQHMLETLRLCRRPGQRAKIDASMETIPDHWHAHLRTV